MKSRSETLFELSQKVIPGGVNSPVRAFKSVGGTPLFIDRAKGSRIWDVDGNSYVDYVGSWGPMVLGHAHPAVVEAVRRVAQQGLSFGAPTEGEYQLASLLCRLLPTLELVRLVSTGTEATMSAIRLARGFSGRRCIVKFEGCYHGHADALLVKAGSGPLTLGQPSSAGVPKEVVAHTLVCSFNDLEGVAQVFERFGNDIAAVIVEPVAGNMNLVAPDEGFLPGLRELCTRHGAILIFDEVMTGFRVGPRGAQGLYAVQPDLTTLGKIVGGGMPLGAFGGRRDIMESIAPLGPVYQAGTLSGNPVAVAAGLATLEAINEQGFFERLEASTVALVDGLQNMAHDEGVTFSAQSVGGMFGLYFQQKPPRSYAEVMAGDRAAFNRFFHAMLAEGVYLAPSAFEAGFVSVAHSDEDIAFTISAAQTVFRQLAAGG